MTAFTLRAAAATAALGLVLATPALAAVGAVPPAPSVQQAIGAIAGHHRRAAAALIAQVSGELGTKAPDAPAVTNLSYARQDLMAGHTDRAMQDRYAALPLLHAAA